MLAIGAVHRSAAPEPVAPVTADATFEVTEEPSPALPAPAPESAVANGRETSAATLRAALGMNPRRPAHAPAAAGEPSALDVLPEAPPARAPRPDVAPVDLGIGDYWKRVATAGARSDAESATASPTVDEILRGPLEARDRALGLGAAGPLVSVAHDAASPRLAPDVGTATLEIECDASGRTVSARVLSADAEPGAWDDVAKELVRLAATKILKLPRGAHGLRARLRIVAERTLPSGEKRAASAGGVPDDQCDGTGINRRCAGGMPTGISGTFGDLSNFGAKRSRIVHVRVLDEESL